MFHKLSNLILLILNVFKPSSASSIISNVDTKYPVLFSPPIRTPENATVLPDTGLNQTNYNNRMYFGASIGVLAKKHGPSFLIGAPNYVGPSNVQTGTVYACKFNQLTSDSTCEEFKLLTNHSKLSQSEFMSLGSSIDIDLDKRALICSPRWMNKFKNPSGRCYRLTRKRSFETVALDVLSPFEDKEYQHVNGYFYSHALFGFTSQFGVNGSRSFIGAPGFDGWRGAVVVYSSVDKHPSVYRLPVEGDSYVGYSVAAGQFYGMNGVYIATGAPRSKFTGVVYIYKARSKTDRSWHSRMRTDKRGNNYMLDVFDKVVEKVGTQVGEYFGATLLAVDINQDGQTDLIVGAPQFSANKRGPGDHGRIVVYMSEKNDLHEKQSIFVETAVGSRFGTAISDVGDLNDDDNTDIAVGAPFEDDNRGAVYIYHGKDDGLNERFSQRISAAELNVGVDLRGFGISISRAWDVDQNEYPDILIGSFLSDKAVLFRTIPVASFEPYLELTRFERSEQIQTLVMKNPTCNFNGTQKRTCFNITYCINIGGKGLGETLEVETTFELDRGSQERRCFFHIENETLHQMTLIKEIPARLFVCFDPLTVYLKDHVVDQISEIKITATAKLVEVERHTFCKHCPIIKSNPIAVKEIVFETGCKTEGGCVAELETRIDLSPPEITEGLHPNVTLVVQVVNSGENAFAAELLLSIEPALEVSATDSHCELQMYNLFKCDLGHPFENLQEKTLKFTFDSLAIKSDIKSVTITAEATTVSSLKDPERAKANITLAIQRFASLQVVRNEIPEVFLYGHNETRESNIGTFRTQIKVVQTNYSTIEDVELTFKFPAVVGGIMFAYEPRLTQRIKPSDASILTCDSIGEQMPRMPGEIYYKELEEHATDTNPFGTNGSSTTRVLKKREAIGEKVKVERTQKGPDDVMTVDCNTANCAIIRCHLGPFKGKDSSSLLEIYGGLDFYKLNQKMRIGHKLIVYKVDIEAKVLDPFVLSSVTNSDIPLHFWSVSKPDGLSFIVIFASAGFGTLLLILIFIALLKLGFFRRKKLEEMKNLVRQSRLSQLNGIGSNPESETVTTTAPDGSDVKVQIRRPTMRLTVPTG